MNSVLVLREEVEEDGEEMDMRWGWLAEQQAVESCVPVEYSCNASARLSCRRSTSSRLSECRILRTSTSERIVSGAMGCLANVNSIVR